MNRDYYLNYIAQYLSILKLSIENLNSINLYNINIVAEDFYSGLLNLIFDTDFKNINTVIRNASSIDLYDKKNSIAFQVTSDASASKIQHTIDEFIKDEYYKDYKSLKVLVLTGKKKSKKTFCTNDLFSFDKDKDIIDNKDLMNIIRPLSEEKLRLINDYLYKELFIKYDQGTRTCENEVETIIALIEFISNNKRLITNRDIIVDPEYKINHRFKEFANNIKDQYMELRSVYGNALDEIEKGTSDAAVDIVTRTYLQDESIRYLNQSGNDPIEALNNMTDFFADKLSMNGKKYDKVAIRYYLLDKVIKCSVFPNERSSYHVS